MPILKQLAQNGSSHGKRRSRSDVTREMISAPLGDFRHTMHVGRGGEEFGDTSFLSPTGGGEEGEGRGEGGDGGLRALPEEEGAGGERKGPATPGAAASPASPSCPIRPAESVLSLFQVDLGPSMLSEVLGVMEKLPTSPCDAPRQEVPVGERAGGRSSSNPGEQEEQEEEGFAFQDGEDTEDEEIRV